MNKKSFYVFTICENGKFYSYADAIQNCNNLVSIFAGIKNLYTANACDTRRQADEIARAWNDSYKQNGTYMFQ